MSALNSCSSEDISKATRQLKVVKSELENLPKGRKVYVQSGLVSRLKAADQEEAALNSNSVFFLHKDPAKLRSEVEQALRKLD